MSWFLHVSSRFPLFICKCEISFVRKCPHLYGFLWTWGILQTRGWSSWVSQRPWTPGRAPFVDAGGTEWDPLTDFVRAVVGASSDQRLYEPPTTKKSLVNHQFLGVPLVPFGGALNPHGWEWPSAKPVVVVICSAVLVVDQGVAVGVGRLGWPYEGNIAPGRCSLHLFVCYPGVNIRKDVENPLGTLRKWSTNM